MPPAGGGRRDCGISQGGAGDDDGHTYLHVRLPRCRGECAGCNEHDRSASPKRGHVVANRCRHPHPRDLTQSIFDVVEVVVLTHSNQIAIPVSLETELRAWVNAVYENAVGNGFVCVPWHPDDTTVRRLKAYFHSGFSPAEAVCACFSPSH